jgi:hypothetical protein
MGSSLLGNELSLQPVLCTPPSIASYCGGQVARYGGWTSCGVSRRLVILADEVECGQIRIRPALQATENSNLKWGHVLP